MSDIWLEKLLLMVPTRSKSQTNKKANTNTNRLMLQIQNATRSKCFAAILKAIWESWMYIFILIAVHENCNLETRTNAKSKKNGLSFSCIPIHKFFKIFLRLWISSSPSPLHENGHTQQMLTDCPVRKMSFSCSSSAAEQEERNLLEKSPS